MRISALIAASVAALALARAADEMTDDDEREECDCADKVPAVLTDAWTCPKCDAVWYPEEDSTDV